MMSMWYYCHAHQIHYHEDNDGEYGGTCPVCNREVVIAELISITTALMSRNGIQEIPEFPQVRDRLLRVLSTRPARKLLDEFTVEEAIATMRGWASDLRWMSDQLADGGWEQITEEEVA